MNTEEDEFRRIEAEAKRRAQAAEDDDTQVYSKPWVGLTAEDLAQINTDEFWQVGNHMAIAMAVEDKLKEKNT